MEGCVNRRSITHIEEEGKEGKEVSLNRKEKKQKEAEKEMGTSKDSLLNWEPGPRGVTLTNQKKTG